MFAICNFRAYSALFRGSLFVGSDCSVLPTYQSRTLTKAGTHPHSSLAQASQLYTAINCQASISCTVYFSCFFFFLDCVLPSSRFISNPVSYYNKVAFNITFPISFVQCFDIRLFLEAEFSKHKLYTCLN